MKILVTTRQKIEAGINIKSSYVVISLHDSDVPPAKVKSQPGLRAVLQVAIDDTDPATPKRLPSSIAMTAEHAEVIWDFVYEHKHEIEAIVVHCNAGYCRSPAVAAAICKVLGGDDRKFFRGKDPNMHMYRTMLNFARK